MKDTLWFIASCGVIMFFALQAVGIPISFLPILVIGSFLTVALVMLVYLLVTFPGRLWRRWRDGR